eukprot:scaffold517_cov255-Pinguiococcus_pyrenoidosus.AAC.23
MVSWTIGFPQPRSRCPGREYPSTSNRRTYTPGNLIRLCAGTSAEQVENAVVWKRKTVGIRNTPSLKKGATSSCIRHTALDRNRRHPAASSVQPQNTDSCRDGRDERACVSSGQWVASCLGSWKVRIWEGAIRQHAHRRTRFRSEDLSVSHPDPVPRSSVCCAAGEGGVGHRSPSATSPERESFGFCGRGSVAQRTLQCTCAF